MKHNKYFLVILLILCSATSCKKGFLDVGDNSTLNRQSYVKDLSTMEQFLNGTYVLLSQHFENGIGAAYPELVADNLKPLPLPPQSLLPQYTWSQQAVEKIEYSASESSLAMNGNWTSGYLIIRACNFVIENVDKYRNENPTKSDNIKGQAYAIRALVYFKLLNIFAQPFKFTPNASHIGVPYITTSDISAPYHRQTVAEGYDGLVSDFNNAIQLLPANISDTRYINRAAAGALLARTYLFKEDFIAAQSLAQKICKEVPLLAIAEGYPNDLFKNKVPSQTEILFQVTPEDDAYYSSFIGASLRGPYVLYTATNDIAAILQENPSDIRNSWVTNTSGNWNVTKYPVNSTGTPALHSTPEADYYQPIIRSSEMYLTAAEAFAKTGNENNARVYLDAIRKRSDPAIPSITATGSALLDSIYKERRKELAFEGLRMYDLQRWKLGVHRIDALYPTFKDLPFPSNRAIAPIPATDVKLAGIQQNDGY